MELVRGFIGDCLELGGGTTPTKKDVQEILAQELMLRAAEAPTLTHRDNRDPDYFDEAKRSKLRSQVLNELLTLERLDDDDSIRLNNGGALPKGKNLKSNRQAYFVTGLPASGKSQIVNTVADAASALVVDSDYAKRKLPEFNGTPGGASLVHDEANEIMFVGKNSLIAKCIAMGYNIVIPKIGSTIDSICSLKEVLISAGYEVHFTLVELDRFSATCRAYERFKRTGRYVPLSLIFDGYANDPILVYYKHKSNKWSSWGAVSTAGPTPKKIESSSVDNPANLF
jgi:hypothetical protein